MSIKKLEFPVLVFVYGSLKKGYWNHPRLGDAKFIGEAETVGKFRLVDLGSFPAILHGKGKETVKGELYEVSEEGLASCDALEGHPNFYHRIQIEVEWPSDPDSLCEGIHKAKAWTYFLCKRREVQPQIVIPTGVWPYRKAA